MSDVLYASALEVRISPCLEYTIEQHLVKLVERGIGKRLGCVVQGCQQLIQFGIVWTYW